MKAFYKINFLILTGVLLFSSDAISDCDKACQLNQVEIYFQNLDDIYKRNSTVKDIDKFLNHMHGAVNYIHTEHEADFDKASWKEAFMRLHKAGVYKSNEKDKTEILNKIHGKNYIAIEYAYNKLSDKGEMIQGAPQLVLFKFTDNKISRIEELW